MEYYIIMGINCEVESGEEWVRWSSCWGDGRSYVWSMTGGAGVAVGWLFDFCGQEAIICAYLCAYVPI